MTACKFQVGDRIIGNEGNKYGITKRGINHEVISVFNTAVTNDIRVRVLEGTNKGYVDLVSSSRFDLVKSAKETAKTAKTESRFPPKYKVDFNSDLGVTFIRVGDVTIAVPLPKHSVSITVKHPNDVDCDETAKAIAFYRLVKGDKK
jgi:hypothetical protein